MPIINTSYFQTGTDTSDATATASQILAPYTAYVASGKVTGTIQSQGAQTITPGTSNQIIQAGKYLSGAQTILGDSDLIPGNIKNGVSIFGVSGTYSGQTGYEAIRFYNSGITVSSNTQLTIPGVSLQSLYGIIAFPTSIPSLDNMTTSGDFGVVIDNMSPSAGFFDGFYGYVSKSLGSTPGGSTYAIDVSMSISGSNTVITVSDNNGFFPGFNNMTYYYLRGIY